MSLVTVLNGDGIAPKSWPRRRASSRPPSDSEFAIELQSALIGGAAIDASGSPLPFDAQSAHAVRGGSPRPSAVPSGITFPARSSANAAFSTFERGWEPTQNCARSNLTAFHRSSSSSSGAARGRRPRCRARAHLEASILVRSAGPETRRRTSAPIRSAKSNAWCASRSQWREVVAST